MDEILHQLIGSFSHYFLYKVLYIPGGCLKFLNQQQYLSLYRFRIPCHVELQGYSLIWNTWA